MKKLTESLLNEEPQTDSESFHVVALSYGLHFACLILLMLAYYREILIQNSEHDVRQLLLLTQHKMQMFRFFFLGLVIGYPYIFLQTLLMKIWSTILNINISFSLCGHCVQLPKFLLIVGWGPYWLIRYFAFGDILAPPTGIWGNILEILSVLIVPIQIFLWFLGCALLRKYGKTSWIQAILGYTLPNVFMFFAVPNIVVWLLLQLVAEQYL